jgi:hypothetical protein
MAREICLSPLSWTDRTGDANNARQVRLFASPNCAVPIYEQQDDAPSLAQSGVKIIAPSQGSAEATLQW